MSPITTTITKEIEHDVSPVKPHSGILKVMKQISKREGDDLQLDTLSLELSDDSSVTSSSSVLDLLSSSSDIERINSPTKKTVTFSRILVIQCHKITIGDNPSCRILPLSLDWEHAEPTVLDLDQYESNPATKRRRRRGARKLMFFERNELLLDVSGYTPAELYKAKKEGLEAQKRDHEFKQVLCACN
jgi:hypothetical protein